MYVIIGKCALNLFVKGSLMLSENDYTTLQVSRHPCVRIMLNRAKGNCSEHVKVDALKNYMQCGSFYCCRAANSFNLS